MEETYSVMAGKSATVAAAEALNRLIGLVKSDAKHSDLIAAGLTGDRTVHQGLIKALKDISDTANGQRKHDASDAIRKAEPSELASDAAIQRLGVVNITDLGHENVYLEKDGIAYYFKPGNNDLFSVGLHDFSKVVVFG